MSAPRREGYARLWAALLWLGLAALFVSWAALVWHPWIDWFGRTR